jgi:hypothetical protein
MVSFDVPLVLEPDTCLPAQFAALQQSGQLSGELRLLTAILADALHCLKRRTTPADKREYRAAMEWVNERDLEYPASFEVICTALRLCPDAVRVAITHDTFNTGCLKDRCRTTNRLRGYRRRGFKMREAVTR